MGNFGAVFAFEWKRALTLPRIAWWFVLAAFPVFIIGILRFATSYETGRRGIPNPPELWIGFLFALVPMLVAMLGTMLWVTPAISAELERRSWVYLSVRPHGGTAVLLGKYLAAVTWVLPPALVGLSIAVWLSEVENGWRVWWAMARLVCLSTPAFGAVFTLLGTALPRRAMVVAVGYSIVFELIISFVPALINRITVHHRLQALLIDWCQLTGSEDFVSVTEALLGADPSWVHVAILLAYPPVLLLVSVLILRWCEFSSAAESED